MVLFLNHPSVYVISLYVNGSSRLATENLMEDMTMTNAKTDTNSNAFSNISIKSCARSFLGGANLVLFLLCTLVVLAFLIIVATQGINASTLMIIICGMFILFLLTTLYTCVIKQNQIILLLEHLGKVHIEDLEAFDSMHRND